VNQQALPEPGAGVVLDTNLLVLYLVGRVRPTAIATTKITSRYRDSDFYLLDELIRRYDAITSMTTTPHVLAETSNLGRKLPTYVHTQFFFAFSAAVRAMTEELVPAADIVESPLLTKLGVADVGLWKLANTHLVVTDDFPLAQRLETDSRRVLNFNHFRRP